MSEPLGPDQLAEKFRQLQEEGDEHGYTDPESVHGGMDELMVEELRRLGYEEAADIFEEQRKWYA